MANTNYSKPKVEIQQVVTTIAPPVGTGALPATVVAPCFEIVEAYLGGTLNEDARYGSYSQNKLTIADTALPSPHNVSNQRILQPDSVRAYLSSAGVVEELKETAFLAAAHIAKRVGLKSGADVDLTNLVGKTLYFAIDVAVPYDYSANKNYSVTFELPTGASSLTMDDVVSQINTAVGAEVASYEGNRLIITSPTYGAISSVVIRKGSGDTANQYLHLGWDGTSNINQFISGQGFYPVDDGDGDTTTPWIGITEGHYMEGDDWTETDIGSKAGEGEPIWIDIEGTTYTTKPSVPSLSSFNLRVGDYIIADGEQVASAEISEISSTRFKLGVLNVNLSTFDSDGNPIYKVYDPAEVNLLTADSPFSPKYVYFIANNLSHEEAGTPAKVQSVLPIKESQPAKVVADNAPLGNTLEGLNLKVAMYDQGVAIIDSLVYFSNDASDGHVATLASFLNTELPEGINASEEKISAAEMTWTVGSLNLTSLQIQFQVTDDYGTTWSATYDTTDLSGSYADTNALRAALNQTSHDYLNDTKAYFEVEGTGPYTIKLKTFGIGEKYGLQIISSSVQSDAEASPVEPSAVQTFGLSKLALVTSRTGKAISLAVLPDGSANAILGFSTTTTQSATGQDPYIEVTPPKILIGPVDFDAIDNTDSIVVTLTAAGGSSYTYTWNPSAAVTNIVELENVSWSGPADYSVSQSVQMKEGGIYLAAEFHRANYDTATKLEITSISADLGSDYYGGRYSRGADPFDPAYSLYVNVNQVLVSSNVSSYEVYELVNQINRAAGFDIIQYNNTENRLELISPTVGIGSELTIYLTSDLSSLGHPDFGWAFSGDLSASEVSSQGIGRPDPNFYMDGPTAVIGAHIIRDKFTGYPIAGGIGSLYFDFSALRLDVTPEAQNPGLVTMGMEDITLNLDPISPQNPFGLMMYLASQAAGGQPVSGIAVPEVSTKYPNGTPVGYSKCFDFLKNYTNEVYAIAIATNELSIIQALQQHVNTMSQPEKQGERVAIVADKYPDREPDNLLVSGTDASYYNYKTITIEIPIASYVAGAGIDPNNDIPASTDLYISFTWEGDIKRYKIKRINNTALEVDLSVSTTDGFYTVEPVPTDLSGADWTVGIRGDLLEVAGQLDKDRLAQAASKIAQNFGDRRVVLLFSDDITLSTSEGEVVVPNYYATACVAGMVQAYDPQIPFTNRIIPGISSVSGTSRFLTEDQMDVVAGGGRFILVQEVEGGPVTCRHQLTTDMSSVKTRELSILRQVDRYVKALRNACSPRIGRVVIDRNTLQEIAMIFASVTQLFISRGWIAGASLSKLEVDKNNPDTVLMTIDLTTKDPYNRLRITVRI